MAESGDVGFIIGRIKELFVERIITTVLPRLRCRTSLPIHSIWIYAVIVIGVVNRIGICIVAEEILSCGTRIVFVCMLLVASRYYCLLL